MPSMLRFVHPDFDATHGAAGLVPSATGELQLVDEDAAIRQSLLLVLTTVPGERVMRPDYGCDLRSLLFAPNDDTTAGLAVHLVRRALARFEPRAELLRVEVERSSASAERLELVLDYRARPTHRSHTLRVTLDLVEGIA